MPSPVTEDIYVTYNANSPQHFTFADGNGNAIPNGDLSAYPGANSFTFHPAAGQSWSFNMLQVSIKGTSGGGEVTMASNSLLTLTINPVDANGLNTIRIDDDDRETRDEILEYSFVILDNGAYIVCDPKIYNRS